MMLNSGGEASIFDEDGVGVCAGELATARCDLKTLLVRSTESL